MKLLRLFVFAISSLILPSCVTNQFLTSATTSNEITSLAYFEPFSHIQLIEKGNKPNFSDSLSTTTQERLDSLLTKNKSSIRLNEKITFKDDKIKAKVESEIGYLAKIIMQRKRLSGVRLTPAIDSILESHNQRFALATVATGFGRRKGNYGGQVAKGAAIGILTLGMAVPTPIKSNLTMYAFIFDSRENQVTYYKRGLPVEKDPTEPAVLEKQLLSLFNGYFYEKK